MLKLVSRRFEDIAGLEDAKSVLQEALVMPLLMPELFTGIRRPVKVSHNEWRLSCSVFTHLAVVCRHRVGCMVLASRGGGAVARAA